MIEQCSGSTIVFNGEIYNYRPLRDELLAAGEQFAGHCDTEVLLRGLVRWGTDFIARLQGMYAFGWLDRPSNRLILARDPAGMKPLYVAQAGGIILFASEMRAILASGAVPRTFDRAGIAGLLAYGAIQEPHTIFEAVQAFPAGCWSEIGPSTHWHWKQKRFWSFPQRRAEMIRENGVIAQIRETTEAAVRDHLVADVPVGVFLSSGIDSTIIASIAARCKPDMRTFTVGFADEPDMSELKAAAHTAALLHLSHCPIQITGSDAEQSTREWFDSLDQPSVDGLNTYVLSKAVRSQGITVAISGLGGDELFGGYSSFEDVPRMRSAVRLMRWIPRTIRAAAAGTLPFWRPSAYREKMRDTFATDGGTRELFLVRRRFMSDSQLHLLGIDGEAASLYSGNGMQDIHGCDADPVYEVTQLECRLYMGNTLLRDTDSNSMAHSLEIRVPLLDQRLMDLIPAIPGHIRLPHGRADKHLLRSAFGHYLPKELNDQPKKGFTLPINRWMTGPLRDLCEASLTDVKRSGLVEPRGVDAIWRAFIREPRSAAWSRGFVLCVLGSYLRRMTRAA